jgi:cell wall-associated NlpC family hydrolase
MRSFERHVECAEHKGHAFPACAACFAAGSRETSERRARVVAFARSMVGKPFSHLGRTDAGVDCVGLVILAFRAGGLDIQDFATYRHRDEEIDYAAEARRHWTTSEDLTANEGDAFLFKVKRYPSHFGIATADGTLIQASDKSGMVIETRFDERWARRAVLRIEAHGQQ